MSVSTVRTQTWEKLGRQKQLKMLRGTHQEKKRFVPELIVIVSELIHVDGTSLNLLNEIRHNSPSTTVVSEN